MTGLQANHACSTFDAFAPYYDAFTAHHDYATWTTNLVALVGEPEGERRLLDLACGTGKSFLPMLERGYEVTACDISPEMVAAARAKAGDRARVEVADMRSLPVLGEFDLAFALCDAVNFLVGDGELGQALARIAPNLRPGGALVFDANTLASFRSFFASTLVCPGEREVLIWEGGAAPGFEPGDRAPAVVSAFTTQDDGWWAKASFTHFERHHPEAEVRDAIAAAGLECEGVFGHGLDGVPSPGVNELVDTKAIYVARKPCQR